MGKERTKTEVKPGNDSKSVNTGRGKAATPNVVAANAPPAAAKPTWISLLSRPRFRLLDLPLELQRLVFHHHFGGPYNITLENERLTMLRSRFHVYGLPPIDLLLTSRNVSTHAAPIRRSLFTGRLVLNSVFILIPLSRQDRFAWLRENTRILHFSDSSVHPERWGRYYGVLGGLEKLEIVFSSVIKLDTSSEGSDFKGWGLEDVLSGREEVDAWLVGSLDKFRLTLVEQLREGKLDVVVTQRYDLRGGMQLEELVEIDIRLAENGAEIVSRRACAKKKQLNADLPRRPAELVRANGNVIDAGSHRSIWEWHQAMST